jgi:large subunit ribosomal protein L30
MQQVDNKTTSSGGKLNITLVKSTIGSLVVHKRTVQALGLKKVGQTVQQDDNACVNGMIFRVQHLVSVSKA